MEYRLPSFDKAVKYDVWKAIRTDAVMRESRQFLMIMVVTAIAL